MNSVLISCLFQQEDSSKPFRARCISLIITTSNSRSVQVRDVIQELPFHYLDLKFLSFSSPHVPSLSSIFLSVGKHPKPSQPVSLPTDFPHLICFYDFIQVDFIDLIMLLFPTYLVSLCKIKSDFHTVVFKGFMIPFKPTLKKTLYLHSYPSTAWHNVFGVSLKVSFIPSYLWLICSIFSNVPFYLVTVELHIHLCFIWSWKSQQVWLTILKLNRL